MGESVALRRARFASFAAPPRAVHERPYGIVDLFVMKGASMELASGCFYVLVAVGGYWGFGYLVVVGDFEGSDYGAVFFY